jgi:hypothetical protein
LVDGAPKRFDKIHAHISTIANMAMAGKTLMRLTSCARSVPILEIKPGLVARVS